MEENAKIKPSKNYLEADTGVKYKEVGQEAIEKPKFVNKHISDGQPHYTELKKDDDVKYFNKIILCLVVLEKNCRNSRRLKNCL